MLFLFSQACRTMQLMETLEKWGMQVPKKLKDLLTANKTKFKKEVDEVVVEVITEQDLALSPPRPEPLQDFDQFGSNLGAVNPATTSSLRSPSLAVDRSMGVVPEIALEGSLEPEPNAQTKGIPVEEGV
ncbi:hypothetical protein F2Q69_00035195 [Brassica cretica]|uniref:Uncharacterized protein n=1 Tax=Brassica cretica TaxID=69181 RepID=A0A8S9SBV0_BRACR|nr:hypothetical protein F2Q69_00035195 [Brassica cretica]